MAEERDEIVLQLEAMARHRQMGRVGSGGPSGGSSSGAGGASRRSSGAGGTVNGDDEGEEDDDDGGSEEDENEHPRKKQKRTRGKKHKQVSEAYLLIEEYTKSSVFRNLKFSRLNGGRAFESNIRETVTKNGLLVDDTEGTWREWWSEHASMLHMVNKNQRGNVVRNLKLNLCGVRVPLMAEAIGNPYLFCFP